MKKLMILTAMVALCAGARADYNMMFRLTVAGIDSYVEDTTTSPYGLKWGDETGTLPKDMICAIIDTTQKASSETGYLTISSVNVYEAYGKGGVGVNPPSGSVDTWSAVMTVTKTIPDESFNPYAGDENRAKLRAVVYSSSRGMYQMSSLDKLGDATGIGAVMSFNPVPTPTPEPTSAVLLLLGMAGLGLKRKRA